MITAAWEATMSATRPRTNNPSNSRLLAGIFLGFLARYDTDLLLTGGGA
jgi:hypothetical protein